MKELWPNINAAGSKMVKEIVEPMFKTMLPGPLKSLHFTKIDLGPVPLRLSNARTTKTDADGIKLDLNVDWASKSDIELDADMMPALVSRLINISRNWTHGLSRYLGRRKHTPPRQARDFAMSTDKYHSFGM